MFKLVTDEFGEVEVSFRHTIMNGSFEHRGITECFIIQKTSDKLLSIGTARCSKMDNFCKEAGRRLSLTRALRYFEEEKTSMLARVTPIERELRRQFWNAYWFTKERDRAKARM